MHFIEFYINICSTETSSQAAEVYIYFAPLYISPFFMNSHHYKGESMKFSLDFLADSRP